MRIDAHQHFWRYSAAEYGWIDDTMRAIRRDFLPGDLAPILETTQIDGSVAVQARQSHAETDWLLELANSSPFIKGVVGWLPLADHGQRSGVLLDHYGKNPRFKGVRHVLQAEPDSYFANSGFNEALGEVSKRNLTYDLLILARQLPAAIAWTDLHPSLRIVLDHIAKPVVQGPPSHEWRDQITELAQRPNVFCKFSGVVTEVPGGQWTPELLQPYFEVVLEAFGPKRLMFGSDWPVCLVASGYIRWYNFVNVCVKRLTPDEGAAILGRNAVQIYQLNS